jgi:hypothetical protein
MQKVGTQAKFCMPLKEPEDGQLTRYSGGGGVAMLLRRSSTSA